MTTTKHSRRTVLAGIAAGGAVATTATTAIAAVPTPDPLLAMEPEFLAADKAWTDSLLVADRADVAGLPTASALEAAADRLDERALALLEKIAITPAVSLEGVLVKLRLAAHTKEYLPSAFPYDLVQVAHDDVVRLAEGGAA